MSSGENLTGAVCYAPYSLQIYRGLLGKAAQYPNLNIPPFPQVSRPILNQATLYVRHDIDTARCLHNMPAMLEIDRKFGVRAGIYFRVDDKEYALGAHRDTVRRHCEADFEVGLHTTCYLRDDYLKAFEEETDKFTIELGFRPKTFTVHGLGQHRLEVRHRFCEEIRTRLRDFGYSFTDCHPKMRTYKHVIHDCHMDGRCEGQRHLRRDFFELHAVVPRRGNILILTHPGYWEG